MFGRSDLCEDGCAIAVRFILQSAIFHLRFLTVALVLAVAVTGCATPVTPVRPPDPTPPAQVSESTWWQIGNDISAASLAAKESARHHARCAMEDWRTRVRKRTETDFIPWFTGYWTQQWLTMKLAWYKLSEEEGTDPAVERLAAYLQAQYHDRVLAPVAKEIDPDAVREQATKHYVQQLGKQLQAIPQRYGVPSDQFEHRMGGIPAIALAPHPARRFALPGPPCRPDRQTARL